MVHGHLSHFNSLSMGFNLCNLFERIVRSWGAEHVQVTGDTMTLDPDQNIERSIRLTGTLEGYLDIRCGEGFLDWLQAQRSDHFLGQYPAEEILDELIGLFCLYLYHDFWSPENFHIGPLKPAPSDPRNWPSPEPDYACSILVEDHPVDIRLWLDKVADR